MNPQKFSPKPAKLPRRMRALVKARPEPGLELREVPVPRPGPDEVLIRVELASICGTDLHIHRWDDWAQGVIRPPLVIGHEFVGRVARLGALVKGLRLGDLICGEGHIVCGHCRNCLAGRRHLCPDTQGVGVHRAGAFADYLCIPAANVWPADATIPLEVLSCFDPLGNAAHTALSFDLVGEDVLITGAGPIGLMACAIARHCGARHIVVSDVNPQRLRLAKRMGASRGVRADHESLTEVARSLCMKEGFDVGFEMSGSPEALDTMIAAMAHGGRIALLGLQKQPAPVAVNRVVLHGLTLKGIYGRQMFETWYKMTMLVKTGLDIRPIITHRFSCTKHKQAFDLVASGKCGKVILDWRG